MPLQIGARLGPYEIVTAIGAGGMGAVYQAVLPFLIEGSVLPSVQFPTIHTHGGPWPGGAT